MLENNNRNLLIVDDEVQVIHSLKRLFKDKGYNIITSSNGQEALEYFQDKQKDIGVVLTDFQMAGMRGTELLAKVKECSPETVRILLTGKTESVSINSAVNDGALHKFLDKPWDNEQLVHTIDDAFKEYELVKENNRLTDELTKANVELVSINKKLESEVLTKAKSLIQAIYYDELTGLPSMTLLKDRLDQAIKMARRNATSISVMYLSIDNAQSLKESLGQNKVDKLIVAIANRLSNSMRASDSISRISHDQFCLMFPNDSLEKPTVVAERILNSAKSPFLIEKQTVLLSVSVGISLFPIDGDSVDGLLTSAMNAMQEIYNAEKSNYKFYSKKISDKNVLRDEIQQDLNRAIEQQEFCLHYQPRINTFSNQITGVEALMRWQHPEKGLLMPYDFIPLLEESGLMNQVGEWLINECAETLKQWQFKNIYDVNISLNISARQFYQGRFLEIVQDAIHKKGVDLHHSKLEFEFTEGLLIEDVNLAKKMLSELREMGAYISIDDFGTGYSSLSYLANFKADFIKIDRSFIRDIARSRKAKKFVGAIVSLAKSLDIQVIAEGVEEVDQLHELNSMECHECQGYLFSKPLPEHAMLNLFQQKRDRLILNG